MLVLLAAAALAADLEVCPGPRAPCHSPQKSFAPYELSFKLPAALEANRAYRSEAFPAVVLEEFPRLAPGDDCDAGEFSKKVEERRRKAQGRFLDRKVFASHQCPDMGAVLYEEDGRRLASFFVAVYAGRTPAEAAGVLKAALKAFPGARLRTLRAVYTRLEE